MSVALVLTTCAENCSTCQNGVKTGLGNIEELLLSAGRASPLITIHREQVGPEVCRIGRVLGVDSGRVSLLEIGPDAI
jgi:hypothetical protein